MAITIVNGFLGAGKTTIILNLLKQISEQNDAAQSEMTATQPDSEGSEGKRPTTKYSVVWLKNEFGINEVDSLLAAESAIQDVKEILNGCLCCTLVGRLGEAVSEILNTTQCHRIIIETTGYASSAPLVQELNRLRADLNMPIFVDGVVCVIDALNLEGYEDTSKTAQMQARYTDLLIINKRELVDEEQIERVKDLLLALNPSAPIIYSNKGCVSPDLIFGLDTAVELYLPDASRGATLVPSEADDITVMHMEWPTSFSAGSTPGLGWEVKEHEFLPTCEEFSALLELLNPNAPANIREAGVCYRIKGVVLLQVPSPDSEDGSSTKAKPFICNCSFGRTTLTPFDAAMENSKLLHNYCFPTELFVQTHRGWCQSDAAKSNATTETTDTGPQQAHGREPEKQFPSRFYSRLTLIGVGLTVGRTPFALAEKFPIRYRAFVSPKCGLLTVDPNAPSWLWRQRNIGNLIPLGNGSEAQSAARHLHQCDAEHSCCGVHHE